MKQPITGIGSDIKKSLQIKYDHIGLYTFHYIYTVIHNYGNPYEKWNIFVARPHLWLQLGMVKPEIMQEKVYKKRIKDIDELRARILTAWDEMDQRIIDAAIRQWRTRLRACIKAKGGHFEHTLSQ